MARSHAHQISSSSEGRSDSGIRDDQSKHAPDLASVGRTTAIYARSRQQGRPRLEISRVRHGTTYVHNTGIHTDNFTDITDNYPSRSIPTRQVFIPVLGPDPFPNNEQPVRIILVFDCLQRRIMLAEKCFLPIDLEGGRLVNIATVGINEPHFLPHMQR